MAQGKPWKWDLVAETTWTEPADEVYGVAVGWKRANRRRVLDLGCGIGRHSVLLAEMGFSVYASELSEIGLGRTAATSRQRGLPLSLARSDMHALPYAAGSFDAVLAFHVIYHTDRVGIERVISEIHRVLAPAGEVYLTFISKQNRSFSDPQSVHIAENTVIKTQDGHEAGIPHYYVDDQEIVRLMSPGFEIHRVDHVGRIIPDLQSWHYFVLAGKRQGS